MSSSSIISTTMSYRFAFRFSVTPSIIIDFDWSAGLTVGSRVGFDLVEGALNDAAMFSSLFLSFSNFSLSDSISLHREFSSNFVSEYLSLKVSTSECSFSFVSVSLVDSIAVLDRSASFLTFVTLAVSLFTLLERN